MPTVIISVTRRERVRERVERKEGREGERKRERERDGGRDGAGERERVRSLNAPLQGIQI